MNYDGVTAAERNLLLVAAASGEAKILIVDNEPEDLKTLYSFLNDCDFNVRTCEDKEGAILRLKQERYDAAIINITMPELGGIGFLASIKQLNLDTEVIIITNTPSFDTALEALRHGACDYLQKPINLEYLKDIIGRIRTKSRLKSKNILRTEDGRPEHTIKYGNIVGISHKIQNIRHIIDRISGRSPTVLLLGESGTGKELVAREIHERSNRKGKPFVPVNCGAIVEGLLESELFGHVKGAFSGALQDKEGLFVIAEGGTIFLDEIGEMPLTLQVKLLRVLQDKSVRPVGGTTEKTVDVRIIAATNIKPAEAIANNKLREDLFYRLNVVSIIIPPLIDRREDIPLLIHSFIERFNNTGSRKVSGVSSEAMDAMLQYNWPGNVRQLENAIERAFAVGMADAILLEDLPAEIAKKYLPKQNEETLSIRENEKILIIKALRKTGGNKIEAANLLDINLATLYRKLKRYGMPLT